MTVSRYDSRVVFKNSNERYRNILKARGESSITHYNTPRLTKLKEADYIKLKTIPHIWNIGDRYYKLAATYYDDPTLWWLIAWFNQKPTDGHLKIGDPVYIPVSLEDLLYYYNLR
jgi:hypothetical protein